MSEEPYSPPPADTATARSAGGGAATVTEDPAATRDPEPLRTPGSPPPAAPPGYAIESELGRGGMGVVYRARQLDLNRTVALKMVLGGGHASPTARVRFLQEIELVGLLDHPNVVRVYHAGTHAGLPFFAMEHVPGGNLAARIANGPLAPREAAQLVEQLAGGVAYCHDRGVLHRDLKPANVLIAADGTPKVTDFGLARLP